MKLKVFIFIMLFSSVSVFAQSNDDAALKSLVKQMTDAARNHQPDALDKLFTADYIEISPVGEFDSREKVLGFYSPELKPPADKMSVKLEISDYSIRNYGKFAIVIARFEYTVTRDGNQQPPRSVRATIVCRKEKNAWKIASTQYTAMRPPPPPAKAS